LTQQVGTAINRHPRSHIAHNHRTDYPPRARVLGGGREASPTTRPRGLFFKRIEQRVTDEELALFPADIALIDRILKGAHILPNRDLTVSGGVARGLKTDDIHGTPPSRDIVADHPIVEQTPRFSL
jgi:hypothetical protein